MKLLVFLICSLLFATTAFALVIQGERSCTVGDRVLKHNEVGPAPLGECQDVQCRNGEINPYIGCGLFQRDPNCPPGTQTEDLTKLFPDCCPQKC